MKWHIVVAMFENWFKKPYQEKQGFLHKLGSKTDWLKEGTLRIYPNGLHVYVNETGNFKYLADATTKPNHFLVADLGSEFIVAE